MIDFAPSPCSRSICMFREKGRVIQWRSNWLFFVPKTDGKGSDLEFEHVTGVSFIWQTV